MQNTNLSQITQISFPEVNPSNLIQQLSDENVRLRQIIDEMANRLTTQQELIQQLRDEIANLRARQVINSLTGRCESSRDCVVKEGVVLQEYNPFFNNLNPGALALPNQEVYFLTGP